MAAGILEGGSRVTLMFSLRLRLTWKEVLREGEGERERERQ